MSKRGRVNAMAYRQERLDLRIRWLDRFRHPVRLDTPIDNDRRAAALDLPPINRRVSTSANEIE
jgi:hypothetical protein